MVLVITHNFFPFCCSHPLPLKKNSPLRVRVIPIQSEVHPRIQHIDSVHTSTHHTFFRSHASTTISQQLRCPVRPGCGKSPLSLHTKKLSFATINSKLSLLKGFFFPAGLRCPFLFLHSPSCTGQETELRVRYLLWYFSLTTHNPLAPPSLHVSFTLV